MKPPHKFFWLSRRFFSRATDGMGKCVDLARLLLIRPLTFCEFRSLCGHTLMSPVKSINDVTRSSNLNLTQ